MKSLQANDVISLRALQPFADLVLFLRRKYLFSPPQPKEKGHVMRVFLSTITSVAKWKQTNQASVKIHHTMLAFTSKLLCRRLCSSAAVATAQSGTSASHLEENADIYARFRVKSDSANRLEPIKATRSTLNSARFYEIECVPGRLFPSVTTILKYSKMRFNPTTETAAQRKHMLRGTTVHAYIER